MGTPEVAVLGASPAGLSAALAARLAGAGVHLLEASDAIGVPEPPAKVAFLELLPDRFTVEEDEVRSRFQTVELRGPHGARLPVEAEGLVLDRRAFDRRLADQAERAGVQLHLGLGAVELTEDQHLVAEGLETEAEVLVLADGFPSQAQALLEPVEDPEATRWGAIHRLEGSLRQGPGVLGLSVGSHAPGGRTQLVPLGDQRFEHWTFTDRGPEATVELATQAARGLARAEPELSLSDPEPVAVGRDPTHMVPRRLAGPGLVLAGGAGGLGGLEIGLRSGTMAGKAAARAALGEGQAALEAYERSALAAFAPGYRGLAQVMALAERLDDGQLDALMAPWRAHRLTLDQLSGLAKASLGNRSRSVAALARAYPRAFLQTMLELGQQPGAVIGALRSA